MAVWATGASSGEAARFAVFALGLELRSSFFVFSFVLLSSLFLVFGGGARRCWVALLASSVLSLLGLVV